MPQRKDPRVFAAERLFLLESARLDGRLELLKAHHPKPFAVLERVYDLEATAIIRNTNKAVIKETNKTDGSIKSSLSRAFKLLQLGTATIPKKAHRNSAAPPGFTVVHCVKNHTTHKFLDNRTTHVYINGKNFSPWIIQLILKLCPNVQEIAAPASKVKGSHLTTSKRLCDERSVQLTLLEPRFTTWKPGEKQRRTTEHKAVITWFEQLSPRSLERKQLEELLKNDPVNTEMFLQFYGFLGRESLTLKQILERSPQFTTKSLTVINSKVRAVVHHLGGPITQLKGPAINRVNAITKATAKREYEKNDAASLRVWEDECLSYAKRLSLATIPARLPHRYTSTLKTLAEGKENGRFDLLENKCRAAIEYRFGLDTPEKPTYRTLETVGLLMNFTRERIRQLEQEALFFIAAPTGDESPTQKKGISPKRAAWIADSLTTIESARKNGLLEWFQTSYPRCYTMLETRFGLKENTGPQTQNQTALAHSICQPYLSQIIKISLAYLEGADLSKDDIEFLSKIEHKAFRSYNKKPALEPGSTNP